METVYEKLWKQYKKRIYTCVRECAKIIQLNIVPFLLLEYSYAQRDPIHVYQIYQSKPGNIQFSEEATNKC